MINNLGGPMFATKPPEPYDCKSKSIGTWVSIPIAMNLLKKFLYVLWLRWREDS
jgi:hypothetical protein